MSGHYKFARILKIFAIINIIATLILVLWVWMKTAFYDLWFAMLAAGIIASFIMYAFGEVIQLLSDIKANTAATHNDDVGK